VANRERHQVDCRELGCEDQVALILAVGIIDTTTGLPARISAIARSIGSSSVDGGASECAANRIVDELSVSVSEICVLRSGPGTVAWAS
jgi:hypothetical protein